MKKITGRVGVLLTMAAWLGWIAFLAPVAAQEEPAAQAEPPQEAEEPVPEKARALVAGQVVDESGKGIADAWLTIVAAEDLDVKAHPMPDGAGNFALAELPGAVGAGPWSIGDLGADGYLLVSLSVERLDADGNTLGEEEKLDYVPGVRMPVFRIPPEGSVKIRLVMGDKREVAAKWADARRRAHEAAEAERAEKEKAEGVVGGEAGARWASGNEKFGKQDFAGALEDYDAALKDVPDEPRLLSAKASALFYLGRLEEARQASEDALRAGSKDLQLLLALADRFNKAGDSENTEAVLRALEEFAADSPELYIQRARLSKREGDTTAAVAAYRKATELTPQDLKLRAEMATYCRENGEVDCAREAYAAMVAQNPDFDKTAYYFLGTLTEGQQAIDYFEKAVAHVPEAYIKLCLAYREADEKEKAIAACSKYIELRPDGAQTGDVRALLDSLQQ
jgi:tetratricopeptide (TPR) repeat protein